MALLVWLAEKVNYWISFNSKIQTPKKNKKKPATINRSNVTQGTQCKKLSFFLQFNENTYKDFGRSFCEHRVKHIDRNRYPHSDHLGYGCFLFHHQRFLGPPDFFVQKSEFHYHGCWDWHWPTHTYAATSLHTSVWKDLSKITLQEPLNLRRSNNAVLASNKN